MSRFLRYNLVYIFVAIAGATLMGTSVLNYYGQKMQSDYLELSYLAKDILTELHTIESQLLELESGQRGYLITGNQDYLDSYAQNTRDIQQNFEDFASLATVTSLIPSDTVKAIELLIFDRTAHLDLAIETFRNEGFDAAMKVVSTGDGKRMMDAIRDKIGYLTQLENDLLDERAEAINSFATLNLWVTQIGIFFTLIMLVIASYSIYVRSKNNIELGESISKSNHLLTVAIEDIKIKNQYIGMAAHDLRNPLGAVYSFSELILEDTDNLSDEHRMMTEQILHSSEHALSLVNEMLDVQKIEEGQLEHHFETINVDQVTNVILFGFKDKLTKKEIALDVNIQTDQPLNTNKTVLIQVLDNLISNAIKFSHRNTKINLDISRNDNFLRVSVKDHGIGISKENIPKVFQRFEKIGKPTEGESSTGLGLSIIYDRLHQINGSITCRSEHGKGTEFTALIPIIT
jgi:signal transduction histidine kinase